MIEVKNVVKTFDGFAALNDATISVPTGAVYGLVGPNGAGKSTIIRHLTGIFRQDSGTVDAPIGRSRSDRKKMAVVAGGRPAITHWEVLARYPGVTHLRCRLETGRTHQIRVHMASIHHPVVGDPVYGPHNCITKLHGQCLHAKTLGFIHPITGEHLRFDSELPEYFTHFIASLRRGTV